MRPLWRAIHSKCGSGRAWRQMAQATARATPLARNAEAATALVTRLDAHWARMQGDKRLCEQDTDAVLHLWAEQSGVSAAQRCKLAAAVLTFLLRDGALWGRDASALAGMALEATRCVDQYASEATTPAARQLQSRVAGLLAQLHIRMSNAVHAYECGLRLVSIGVPNPAINEVIAYLVSLGMADGAVSLTRGLVEAGLPVPEAGQLVSLLSLLAFANDVRAGNCTKLLTRQAGSAFWMLETESLSLAMDPLLSGGTVLSQVLECAARTAHATCAGAAMAKLDQNGVALREQHFGALLQAYALSGRIDVATSIPTVMRNGGIAPSAATLDPLLLYFCCVGTHDELLEQMAKAHDVSVLDALVYACGLRGTLRGVRDALPRPLAGSTYDAILLHAVHQRDVETVRTLDREMLQAGVKRSRDTYDLLVIGYTSRMDQPLEPALAALEEARTAGHEPSESALLAIVVRAGRARDPRVDVAIMELLALGYDTRGLDGYARYGAPSFLPVAAGEPDAAAVNKRLDALHTSITRTYSHPQQRRQLIQRLQWIADTSPPALRSAFRRNVSTR